MKSTIRFFQALAACAALLAGAHAMAQGSPFAVAPVNFKLDAKTEFGAVEVSNRGEAPMGVEVTLVKMKWVDGKETYEATDDFTFSPPSFRLQGGKSRMVRFRYGGKRGDAEGIYRLFLRQLPEGDSGAITMLFNVGVPIFVAPVAAAPSLGLDKQAAAAQIRNTGNVTVTISQLEGPACPGPQKVHARMFPGQSFELKDAFACATMAQTERGPITLTAR
jgi:fimbrial chaperone protein